MGGDRLLPDWHGCRLLRLHRPASLLRSPTPPPEIVQPRHHPRWALYSPTQPTPMARPLIEALAARRRRRVRGGRYCVGQCMVRAAWVCASGASGASGASSRSPRCAALTVPRNMPPISPRGVHGIPELRGRHRAYRYRPDKLRLRAPRAARRVLAGAHRSAALGAGVRVQCTLRLLTVGRRV